MRTTSIAIICLLALLLVIAGCGKAECKKDTDCQKQYYTGSCVEKKCDYQKIDTYWCGETLCTGKQGLHLEKKCADDKKTCISDLPKEKVKVTSLVNEMTMAGDKFKITTEFPQPFNTRKEKFRIKLGLAQPAPSNTEHTVTRAELTGLTKDRRTITLAQKDLNKHIWVDADDTNIPLIIDFATTDADGEFSNLVLKLYYNYVQTAGTQKQTRNAILQNNYGNIKFIWAHPDKAYPCPTLCNEEGFGMKGTCNPTTGFCDYTPLPNVCGNNLCDPGENTCTCAQDCGPCAGTVGVYSFKTCTGDNKCIVAIKQGITITPQTLFDDRPLGSFHLQNTYQYNNPFNTKTDKFVVDFKLYQIQPQASGIKIETIRLLEATQQIAEYNVNKDLPTANSNIQQELTIPAQAQPEIDRNLILGVWYQYTQSGVTQKGNYQKSLGKVTLLTPDQ